MANVLEKKILVLGDVMLDEYIFGKSTRISPEAPVPIIEEESRLQALGGSANTANNAKMLGADVRILGVVGNDDAGDRIKKLVKEDGIGEEGILMSESRKTTIKSRIFANGRQVVRFDRENRIPISESIEDLILEKAERLIKKASVVIISDYAKGFVTERISREVISLCLQRSIPVIVDPKGRDFEKYRGATIITPNLSEAQEASGIEIAGDFTLCQVGNFLLESFSFDSVLITQGEKGMTLFRTNQEPFRLHAKARQVFDVTGAGDTVVGTLAVYLASGANLETAVKLANIAAGVAVSRIGTSTVSPEELIGLYYEDNHKEETR